MVLPAAAIGIAAGMFGKKQQTYQAPMFQEMNSNLANMRYENGDIYYKPKFSKTQKQTMKTTDKALARAVQALNQPFSVNSMYNNPFYNSTLGLLNRPLQQQKATDERELTNQLNAMNQIGSSYDAYQRNLLNQRYDGLFQDAKNQAHQASSDAYQSQFNNNLSALTGLQNNRIATQQMAYLPAQLSQLFQR